MCPLPELIIDRYDNGSRTVIALAGEIDCASAPSVGVVIDRCLHEGASLVDVDLTSVTFCDCSGINMFLAAARLADAAGSTLRLREPDPRMIRLLKLTSTTTRLLGGPAPAGSSSPSRPSSPSRSSSPAEFGGTVLNPSDIGSCDASP
jgi:anti-sigma B factor antagonist